LIMPLSCAALVYFILALQVQGGLPPMYRRFGAMPERQLINILPQVFYLVVLLGLFAATEMRVFFCAFGGVALWAGLRIRSQTRVETEGVRDWMLHPVTLRWPMLAFDICLCFSCRERRAQLPRTRGGALHAASGLRGAASRNVRRERAV